MSGVISRRWGRALALTLILPAMLVARSAPAQENGQEKAQGGQEEKAQETPPQETKPFAPGPYEPVKRDSLGTRLINVPTPYTVGAKTLEVIFTHRFHQAINQGGSFSNLWGMDSGADTGLGAAWGFTRNSEVSLYRSSFQENFELAGKFMVLEQAARVPLSLAVRAGVDRLEREGVEDPTRPFVQVLLSRRLRPGMNFLLSPSYVRDTPRLRDAFNVPVGFTFGLPGGGLVELEYIPENHDLEEESRQAWHAAFSKAVGGHIFELVFGNSRATTVDQYVGGDSAAGFETGDIRLGFNIIRYFSY
jgi:hypothetical protein